MPKRLRYTEVLGLNARGLTRHQKKQIVWKKHVKNKLIQKKFSKQKQTITTIAYWDKYHDEQQRFDAMGLKQFLQNPSKILTIPQKQRKITYSKLTKAQLRIEYLKYKYSVAIPDSKSLKILSVLSKGQGVIQMKTSNHSNGYWTHLLTQKGVSCKIFNVYNNNNNNNNKFKKNKHKNLKKSKKILAAEAKEWINIFNKDLSSKVNDILKDYKQYVLLMIYPDFMMDYSVIGDIIEKQNISENENDNNNNDKYRTFGYLMDNKNDILPSIECLKYFKGNYIVHIGELFGYTYNNNNVWGQTTSMEFQIELQKNFHKIYQHEMCRWPMLRDCLTIWKRNKIINVGNSKIIAMNDKEMYDNMNTKYWQSVFKQRVHGKGEKNIFAGANYAPSK